MCAAPATTRCTLLVDQVASLSWNANHAELLPVPAVTTIRGLSAKSSRDAAWFLEADARMYSSSVLRRWRGFTPSNCPRPSLADEESSAETRPTKSYESTLPGDVVALAGDPGSGE